MKQRDLEEQLRNHAWTDEEFHSFLETGKYKELEFEILDEEVQREKGEFTVLEDSTLEYIESLCAYDPDLLSDTREALVASEIKKVLYYAFFYFKEGFSYMDIVQEGIVGLLKGIDFSSQHLEYWIVREIFLKIQGELRDLKFEFKNFLRQKREDLEHSHSHHHEEEHSCSCGHSHEEGHECCGEHEEEEESFSDDKNALLEKLLKNNTAIDEMEKILEEQFDMQALQCRLYAIEVEVLNYYFGLLTEKRHSIYEIEKKFGLKEGHAQSIFENALYKLSTVKGKREL